MANLIIIATHASTPFVVLYHVLVCLRGRVNTGFCALNGQRERIDDDKRVSLNLALHESHDLVGYTRPCMDNL